MSSLSTNSRRRDDGFTLVELAVVVIVIGVLAAFAVPRFRDSVERSKASESLSYLSSVRAAQERYHARQGTYANNLANLDIQMDAPTYFRVGRVSAGSTGNLQSSWKLSLTRTGASAGYGAYSVTFDEQGFNSKSSSLNKLDRINPMKRQ